MSSQVTSERDKPLTALINRVLTEYIDVMLSDIGQAKPNKRVS